MMYEPSRPPKITISEAMIHHTASRAVGIPAALRVVAIGLADMNSLRSVCRFEARRRGAKPTLSFSIEPSRCSQRKHPGLRLARKPL